MRILPCLWVFLAISSATVGRAVDWTADAPRDEPTFSSYRPGTPPRAEPDFPADAATVDGWTEVAGVYQVPQQARQVRVELHFRWGPPNSRLEWGQTSLTPVAAPAPRNVTIATIHYQPRAGSTPAEKRKQFVPLIADAAGEGADLIVLPETLTYYGTGLTYADCAGRCPDHRQLSLVNWPNNTALISLRDCWNATGI